MHKHGSREVPHECIPVGMGVMLACMHAQAHACVKETLGGAVCPAQVFSRQTPKGELQEPAGADRKDQPLSTQ